MPGKTAERNRMREEGESEKSREKERWEMGNGEVEQKVCRRVR